MTSTSFNTGYSLSRNSSKVIKPPGGETADIFGSRSESALGGAYSSATSQAGSDVASSRVHIDTDQQSISGHSNSSSQPVVDGMKASGQVSPSGSVDSSAPGQHQQQPLVLMADDFKPTQQMDMLQSQTMQQPMNIQQQKLIQMQQQNDATRSPKKTIPVLRRNPITGEVYENPSGQPTVVRVRQPPGGRSSGIF